MADRRARGRAATPRGQALVEFGVILPLLIIFLLGVADLGRVFADGIALEAAARNSAEAAAQEYLQLCSQYGDPTACDGQLQQNDYNILHTLALDIGCREAERMTNRQVSGGGCTNPVIAVCVHNNDANDAACGQEGTTGSVPANCTRMNNADQDGVGGADWPWSAVRNGPAEGRPYVEVRACYQFNPLLPLTEFWWGSVWLQKENDFAVTNY